MVEIIVFASSILAYKDDHLVYQHDFNYNTLVECQRNENIDKQTAQDHQNRHIDQQIVYKKCHEKSVPKIKAE